MLVVSKGASTICHHTLHIVTVQGYLQARAYLAETLRKQPHRVPGLVVLDLPYNKTDLAFFSAWLRAAEGLNHIPIIYNEAALSPFMTNLPKQLQLVDDVTNVYQNAATLKYKSKHLGHLLVHRRKDNRFLIQGLLRRMLRWISEGGRRMFDIVVSLTLLVLFSPLFLLIAALIKMESQGPVFYVSPRAGRGYRIFNFYKFRTMVPDADSQRELLENRNQYDNGEGGARFFKIVGDPRVTRFGNLLRNTSLDELPQLINVLKGDMSIVGNRPLPLYEAATLTTNEWAERFMAPAGITGLWQIKKRGRADMSAQERIHLDISYARRSNLVYDLWILANTPGALIQKTDV